MKQFTMTVFHQSTTIDKVRVAIEAENEADAIKTFKEGNYDWIDAKNVDNIDGEFIDEKDWVIEEDA